MARVARTTREVEQRLQTLCPLGRERCLGSHAPGIRSRPGHGQRDTRYHSHSCPYVCSRWIKKNGGQDQQALGRSRGGFSTKIHLIVDALGNPLRFILTPGQRHDVTQSADLIESYEFGHFIADTAFDAEWLRELLTQNGVQAVIPPRANRNVSIEYDKHLYKERHLVECFINKIKWYRRIFTRFEKLACRYKAFLHFVGALIWLR